jgi:hypothetical protein
MEARQVVAGASLGPEVLKVAYAAFDRAWSDIAAHFGNDNETVEAARLKLANAVLAVVREDSRDPIEVKNAALQMVALDGRVRA